MKMVFSTNGVGSFWVKLKVWIYTPVHCGPLSSVWNFLELFRAELGTLPKEKVLSIIWSTSVQIFRNSGAQELIVSSVQIELHRSISRQAYLAESGLTIITFGNCISSSNLRDSICMSTWWEINIYSSV
jgi:hypothetical protein